jgi:dTDP-glucose 4,6-dehydratase
MKRILVTGGSGFIGSAVIHLALSRGYHVVNVDALTYAAGLGNLSGYKDHANYVFQRVHLRDRSALDEVFTAFKPMAVLHLAAESHVDRSIDGPEDFVTTNVVGTFNLLEASRAFWRAFGCLALARFIHVSTDEVFGELGETGSFSESTPYAPRGPYSATKAASDHLARAWHETYGMPVIVTNCSNNYGPYQNPEKLIPQTILRAISGKQIPIYGTGKNVRDWLFVEDHAAALLDVLERGRVGQSYNIGGNSEVQNIEIVRTICGLLDELRPQAFKHETLISFVSDRPGHDFRYAIDSSKISAELGWQAQTKLTEGLAATVKWYLANGSWCGEVLARPDALTRKGLSA